MSLILKLYPSLSINEDDEKLYKTYGYLNGQNVPIECLMNRGYDIIFDSLPTILKNNVQKFEIEYPNVILTIKIPVEITYGDLVEQLINNYGDAGPDTWMEGDITIGPNDQGIPSQAEMFIGMVSLTLMPYY